MPDDFSPNSALIVSRLRSISFLVLISLIVAAGARAGKQHIVVESGTTATQVNNHPWTYTTPGHGETNCTSTGNAQGTAITTGSVTTINATTNADTSCNSTYDPPQTTRGNWATVDNAAWVTDRATGTSYLIQCTANWIASKCSALLGGFYEADLEGNNMWITGLKGTKQTRVKYRVLRVVPGRVATATQSGYEAISDSPGQSTAFGSWTALEKYAWSIYLSLSPEDKEYVQMSCAGNPKTLVFLPRAKVNAGLPSEHVIDCTNWLAARHKSE